MRRHRVWLRLALACGLALPAAAIAQGASQLPPGARIRLARNHGSLHPGTLIRASADSLWVHLEHFRDRSEVEAIAIVRIDSLEVSRGRKPRRLWRSTRNGFVRGAVIGGAFGLLVVGSNREDREFFGGYLGSTAFFAALGAAPGLVIGFIYGVLPPEELWEPVPLR